MIKTLKITSIFAALAAVGFVVFLSVFGLKGDTEIEKFLNSPGAAEKFKKLTKKDSDRKDQISPLVKQAKAFALIINPPPPPKPKPEKKPASKLTDKKKPTTPIPKPIISAKFDLVATCRYELEPQKSMALLDMPAKGLKWYRQGEEVNHLIIEEINDGGIVLFKNGKENSRISIPVVKKKSLLKDQGGYTSKPAMAASLLSDSEVISEPVETEVTPQEKTATQERTLPQRRSRKVRTAPAPEPTPEQKKESLDESIKSIKQIMTETAESDQEDVQDTWMKLLENLENERKTLEKAEDSPEQESPEISDSDTISPEE